MKFEVLQPFLLKREERRGERGHMGLIHKWFMHAVVWSPWWAFGEALEECRPTFQLHFPSLWLRDTADCLCKVNPKGERKNHYNVHYISVWTDEYIMYTYWLIFPQFPLICCSNIYYINDNFDKRTWTYIFGACCATTVFIPSFHNYRIWSFLGLMMTTYTSWYLTIASFIHGQVCIYLN